ncbi:MAG: hypothetical protein HYT37_02780 [Candidatus Sungbacteria bacterium]|nr:hypothetical protein [Candidatus Sungbacteria bacterium]
MAKKKGVTIDELAVMVKAGFDAVDARFEAIDARFDRVDKHFSKLESDIEDLKVRMGAVEQRIGTIEEILEDHSEELRFIHRKINEWTDPRGKKRLITYDEYTKLESRIAELEKKTGIKK